MLEYYSLDGWGNPTGGGRRGRPERGAAGQRQLPGGAPAGDGEDRLRRPAHGAGGEAHARELDPGGGPSPWAAPAASRRGLHGGEGAPGEVAHPTGRLTPTCTGALGAVATGTFPGATVGTGTHAVLVKWDPAARRFTFALDGNAITVDPTASAPFAGAANAPLRRIFASVGVPATAGATGSIDARVNNVFTAP